MPLSTGSSETQKLAPWAAWCQANLTGTEQEMGFSDPSLASTKGFYKQLQPAQPRTALSSGATAPGASTESRTGSV